MGIGAAIGGALSLGGAALSADGARSSANALRRQLAPSNALNLELLKQRVKAAEALENLAGKLESGDPISPQEAQFLDNVFVRTNADIAESRRTTTKDILGDQAGIGFLRSGRSAQQIRRVGIEAESARDRNALNRENTAIQRAFERTVTIPAQLRQSVLTGAVGQPQAIVPQPSSNTFAGQAISGLGSGLISLSGQQLAQQNQNQSLAKLLQQLQSNPNAASV